MGMKVNGMLRLSAKFHAELKAKDECRAYYYVVQATNEHGEERYIYNEVDASFGRVRPSGLSWANVVRSDDACELVRFIHELKQELKKMEDGIYLSLIHI